MRRRRNLKKVVVMRSSTPFHLRFWCSVALAGAVASWTQAAPSSNRQETEVKESEPLPYPTVIIGTVKGKPAKVASVHDMSPQVMVDHKLETLPPNPKLMPVRVRSYAPGSVELTAKKGSAKKTEHTIELADGSKATGPVWDIASDFDLTVQSSDSYDDCYLALMFFNRKFLDGTAPYPGWEFVFQDIGGLTAGKKKTVNVHLGPVRPQAKDMVFVPVVYCGGEEVRSNFSRFTAALFRKAEVAEHVGVVKIWLKDHPKSDEPLKPYVLLQPVFPSSVDMKKLPKTIDATFEVTAAGTVQNPAVKEKLPPKVTAAIRRALGEWLFMPRLKAGKPVATPVAIPLNISNDR